MFIVILSNIGNTSRFFSAQNVVQYILDGTSWDRYCTQHNLQNADLSLAHTTVINRVFLFSTNDVFKVIPYLLWKVLFNASQINVFIKNFNRNIHYVHYDNRASSDNNSFGSSESGLRWVVHDNITEKIKIYKFDQ